MLEYFALGILFFSFIVVFYGIIVIHDIPYEIAERRNHPHQDAIHVAGWISLFTLHVIWPFLWIWATLYRQERGWGFSQVGDTEFSDSVSIHQQLADINERLESLEVQLQHNNQAAEGETD